MTILSLPGTKPSGEKTIFRWRTVETAETRKEAEEKSLAGCQETRRKMGDGGTDSPDEPQCKLIVGTCTRSHGR